jgi:hypothetical protein
MVAYNILPSLCRTTAYYLSLEPLPFETIHAQIEDEMGGTASAAVWDDAMATETVSSWTAVAATSTRAA